MKNLINKNNSLIEYPLVKLDTEKLLFSYVEKFGIGYVIRNYEISSDFFKEISNGEYSNMCDEIYTISEINQFQKTLLFCKK